MKVQNQNGLSEGVELKVAVAHELAKQKLVRAIKEGKLQYHFRNYDMSWWMLGGGTAVPISWDIRQMRAEGIYSEDKNLPLRKSHDNPEVMQLYEEYLGQPNSHKAENLHTHYFPRKRYLN